MAPASKAALLVLLAMLMASSTCVAVPVDWQQAVEEGNMLYSATVPEPGYFPYVGNGYIATEMTTDFMFLAGVFNGLSDVTPSHRAFIPSTVDLFIPTGSNPGAQFVGAALDIEHAAFYNRTKLTHCGGMVVQQKWCVCLCLIVFRVLCLFIFSWDWFGRHHTPVYWCPLWLCAPRTSLSGMLIGPVAM